MMLRSIGVTARTLVIFAFLLLMPLLAFPPIAQWLEQRADALWPMLTALIADSDVLAAPTPEDETFPAPAPIPPRREGRPAPFTPTPPPSDEPRLASSLQQELQRLRELGARDMHWEPFGAAERFVCHVPLDVGGVYARQFDATADDRLASARCVRDAIQSWRQTLRDRQGSVEIEVGLHIPASQLPRSRRQTTPPAPRRDSSAWQGLP